MKQENRGGAREGAGAPKKYHVKYQRYMTEEEVLKMDIYLAKLKNE